MLTSDDKRVHPRRRRRRKRKRKQALAAAPLEQAAVPADPFPLAIEQQHDQVARLTRLARLLPRLRS